MLQIKRFITLALLVSSSLCAAADPAAAVLPGYMQQDLTFSAITNGETNCYQNLRLKPQDLKPLNVVVNAPTHFKAYKHLPFYTASNLYFQDRPQFSHMGIWGECNYSSTSNHVSIGQRSYLVKFLALTTHNQKTNTQVDSYPCKNYSLTLQLCATDDPDCTQICEIRLDQNKT